MPRSMAAKWIRAVGLVMCTPHVACRIRIGGYDVDRNDAVVADDAVGDDAVGRRYAPAVPMLMTCAAAVCVNRACDDDTHTLTAG